MIIDGRVIFIHNLRTSGTATRRALLHGKDPNAGRAFEKHRFARMVKERVPDKVWDSRFKFSIVRNPFDRLVSLYGLFRRPTEPERQARVVGGLGKHPYKLDKFVTSLRRQGVSLAMSKIQKKRLVNLAFSCDFKTWLLWFCEEYCWNGCRYLDNERPMTRIPQVEWFDGLDRVFKFEQLDELHDCLVDMGYPVPVPENQTVHEPWETYYDAETYDFAAKAFAKDIERFGY